VKENNHYLERMINDNGGDSVTNEEQIQAGIEQITDVCNQYAEDAGIKLSAVTFDDGRLHGCSDIHLLSLKLKSLTVNTKLNHEEIEDYPGRAGTELTNAKIKAAIYRLQVMLEG
jgi:hypothetical protein